MRLRDPRVLFGLASLGLVLGVFALDYGQTSPGPLSASHAAIADLAGASGCDACHGGWFSTMTGSCLECHEEIDRQIEARSGLHGALVAAERGDEAARACQTCHVEHHGDQLPLAGAEAFALAGVPAMDAFDHRHVAFALTGRHAQLECAKCHENADAPVLTEGHSRFGGLSQDCTACHEDPHKGRFVQGCASCHGQEKPFGELGSFTHGDAFPLVGAHARPACADCHEKGGDHEVEDLAGRGPVPPARTCADCHESPHRAEMTAEVERRLGLAAGDSCKACHDAERGPFKGDTAGMTAELHAATGFALDRPHEKARCEDCHGAAQVAVRAPLARLAALPATATPAFAVRYPGRTADDCGTCHQGPHGDQFDVQPYLDGGCLSCHEREAYRPHAFGIEEHARCAFPLVESHTAVACDDCHVDPDGPEGAPRQFRGTAKACSACHADVHTLASAKGQFALPADRREELGGCATCHAPDRFASVDREAFDHGLWTAFPLDGAHARADCEACHQASPTPDAEGRTLGRVEERFPGPADRCASCHADPHRGTFTRADGDQVETSDCARCHTTDSFSAGAAVSDFDHGRWTGFALEGAHARVECKSCHGEARPVPDARDATIVSQRSFGFVADRIGGSADSCAACHADPHRGRFDDLDARAAGTSCERCHDQESFTDIDREAFDHERWTGFALRGEHARAKCESCHAPSDHAIEGSVRLGPAPGKECAACHADPHVGQFAAGGRTDCARCHREELDFHALTFDHQRDTRFALDARHEKLACSACHVPWPLSSGETAVRYKPLGTQCVDCHDPTSRGRASGAKGGARGGLR